MAVGCFSWCRLLRQRDAKKQPLSEEVQLAIVPVSAVKISQEPESDEILFEYTGSARPTTTQYIVATGKQTLALLHSAASVIPVPLLQDAIAVAIKIIQVCEEASEVQKNVKDLQERVAHLMIVIVNNVTVKHEEGSGVVAKAVEGIGKDVEDFLRTLRVIDKELTEIRNQNEWLKGLYTDLNVDAVDTCLNQLSTAQEKFQLANNLRDSNLLLDLHARLGNLSKKIDDMHKDLKDVAEGVKDISIYISKSKRSATMIPSDTIVRHRILPLKPEIFHGREDLVKEIAQWLVKKETPRVCLLGPGGMGKTSVSLAVLELPGIRERFPGGNVWVPCIEASSAALLLDILYAQLQVPGDKQVTLEKIIAYLDTSTRRCVILLDNFETPWNAPGPGVQEILRQLAGLSHIAIFITIRGTNPPCDNAIKWQSKNIGPPENEACLRIYRDNNPTSSDPNAEISCLLDVLGYMPFAVTLMAKLAREGKSTAKELLDAWHEEGPDILSDNPEASMSRSISLSVESDLVKRNPSATALLAILSLLPAGTTKKNLHWWARDSALKSSKIPSAIAALSNAALLVENKRENFDSQVLFVVPVVQSFMQHGRIEEKVRTQIQSACCQYVLDHACRYGDPEFPVKSSALAAEDTNIRSILFGSPLTSDRSVEALIAFSWHRCDTKPDVEIANHAVNAANASGVKRHIVSAVWCLGWTYRQLGRFRISYDHLQDAHQLSNDPSADDVELKRLHCQSGICLVDVARLTREDKGKAVSLAQHLESVCATLLDDNIHGLSLVRLGSSLIEAGQPQQALEHLNHALIVLKAVKNTLYLATAYRVIARAYYHSRRLPEALDAIQESCRLVESSSNTSSLASISVNSGFIHFSANRDSEAWRYTENALTKASVIGNRFIIAQALELMGYGYLRKGDYKNAYGAYEAAAEKYQGTVTIHSETRCRNNMARIKRKQKNPDAEVGFERHGLEVDESLFYPLVQASVSGIS